MYQISKQIRLKEGDELFREGEKGDELYFILDGTVEVSKQDPIEQTNYRIETLKPGEVLGEIAFIDRGPRSASVQAKTSVYLRSISFNQLDEFAQKHPDFSRIYAHLSKNISQRLRKINDSTLESIQHEIEENKIRTKMGLFLIYISVSISVYNYSFKGLKYLLTIVPNTSYISVPFTLFIYVCFIIFMRYSQIPWREFEIRFNNTKKSVIDAFLFSLPVMLLLIPMKWILIQFNSSYAGHQLFEPFAVILDLQDKNWSSWLELNSVYWFLIVPVQELLARGTVQTLLEKFLFGKWKVPLSIILSNLIFSTSHTFYSFNLGIVVFCGGLLIGWSYSRTHNLIGCCLLHGLLGTWLFSILGIQVDR